MPPRALSLSKPKEVVAVETGSAAVKTVWVEVSAAFASHQ
jgi:hypothetical protein